MICVSLLGSSLDIFYKNRLSTSNAGSLQPPSVSAASSALLGHLPPSAAGSYPPLPFGPDHPLLSQPHTAAAFARQHCSNLLGLEFLRNVQLSAAAAAGLPSSLPAAMAGGNPHTPPISSSMGGGGSPDFKFNPHMSRGPLGAGGMDTGFSLNQLAAAHHNAAQNAASKLSSSGSDHHMKDGGDDKLNAKLIR